MATDVMPQSSVKNDILKLVEEEEPEESNVDVVETTLMNPPEIEQKSQEASISPTTQQTPQGDAKEITQSGQTSLPKTPAPEEPSTQTSEPASQSKRSIMDIIKDIKIIPRESTSSEVDNWLSAFSIQKDPPSIDFTKIKVFLSSSGPNISRGGEETYTDTHCSMCRSCILSVNDEKKKVERKESERLESYSEGEDDEEGGNGKERGKEEESLNGPVATPTSGLFGWIKQKWDDKHINKHQYKGDIQALKEKVHKKKEENKYMKERRKAVEELTKEEKRAAKNKLLLAKREQALAKQTGDDKDAGASLTKVEQETQQVLKEDESQEAALEKTATTTPGSDNTGEEFREETDSQEIEKIINKVNLRDLKELLNAVYEDIQKDPHQEEELDDMVYSVINMTKQDNKYSDELIRMLFRTMNTNKKWRSYLKKAIDEVNQ